MSKSRPDTLFVVLAGVCIHVMFDTVRATTLVVADWSSYKAGTLSLEHEPFPCS